MTSSILDHGSIALYEHQDPVLRAPGRPHSQQQQLHPYEDVPSWDVLHEPSETSSEDDQLDAISDPHPPEEASKSAKGLPVGRNETTAAPSLAPQTSFSPSPSRVQNLHTTITNSNPRPGPARQRLSLIGVVLTRPPPPPPPRRQTEITCPTPDNDPVCIDQKEEESGQPSSALHFLAKPSPVLSLADALTSSFINNAHQAHLSGSLVERRHQNKVKVAGTGSSSSSVHAGQRQHYSRRSQARPVSERVKGRVLDGNEYAELLGADVSDIRFSAELEASNVNTDQVTRSNLRHLLQSLQREEGSNGQRHVPFKFATHTVSRDVELLDMLDRTFGPDSYRGGGPKPKIVGSPSISSGSRVTSPDANEREAGGVERSTSVLGLRKRESVKDPDNESKRSRNVAMEPALSSIPQSLVANWVVLFQGLVKGKVKVDVSQVAFLSSLIDTIDKVKDGVSYDIALDSNIWKTMCQLSELASEDIPFEQEYKLRGRARDVASFWSRKWSSEEEHD